MFSATTFVIRPATDADASVLRDLAGLDSQSPLTSTVLVGELHGSPAAAMSLDSGRVVADPFQRTGALVAHLRTQAGGVRSARHMPRVRDRIRSGLRVLDPAAIG